MPYLLESSNVNAYLDLASELTIGANIGDYVEFYGYANSGNTGDEYRLLGRATDAGSYIILRPFDLWVRASNDLAQFSAGYVQPTVGSDFVVRVVRDSATTYECFLNGVSLGSVAANGNMLVSQLMSFDTGSTNGFQGGAYYIEVCNDGTGHATHRWINETSAGTSWKDEISGNDAAQGGTWPVDDSEWLEYTTGALVRTSVGGSNSNSTTPSYQLPPVIESGDLILIVSSNDAAAVLTPPAGFSMPSTQDATQFQVNIMGKVADGTEGGTIVVGSLTASESTCYISMAIRNWGGTVVDDIDISLISTGNGTSPNPSGVTAGWGNANNLFIACNISDNWDRTATAFPDGYYKNKFTQQHSDQFGGTQAVSVCTKEILADSDDPPAFTVAGTGNDAYAAFTIVVNSSENSLSGFTRIGEYALPAIVGTHANFRLKLTYDDFVSGVLSSLDDGGGDLRFSFDEIGLNQLPCEVVDFDKVGNRIEVYVKVPAASTGTIIHVWGDNTGALQPSEEDQFGRNAVWTDHEVAMHFETDSTDSTGKGNVISEFGTPSYATPGQAVLVDAGYEINLQRLFTEYTYRFEVTTPASYVDWCSWFRTRSGGSDEFNFQKVGAADDCRLIHYDGSGFETATFTTPWSTIFPVSSTNIYHLVYDGDLSQASLYRDGLLVETVAMVRDLDLTGLTNSDFFYESASINIDATVFDLAMQDVAINADYVATENDNYSASGWGTMTDIGGGPSIDSMDDPIRLDSTSNHTVSNFSSAVDQGDVERAGIQVDGSGVTNTQASWPALAQNFVIPEPGVGATVTLSDGTDVADVTREFLPPAGTEFLTVGTPSGSLQAGDWLFELQQAGGSIEPGVDGIIRTIGDPVAVNNIDGTTTYLDYGTSIVYSWDRNADVGEDGGLTLITLNNLESGPILTLPTGTATGETTADGTVTTDEADGTLYYLTSENATEDIATIKAGNSQSVISSGIQNISVTGLTAETTYYNHYVHTNALLEDSNVASSPAFTTDAIKAPVLTSPTGVATGQTTADGTVMTDESDGTLYYLTSENITEDIATIKAGNSQPVTASGVQNISVTGLTAGTTYYNHYVHTNDLLEDSNVASSPAFVTDAIEAPVLSPIRTINVGLNSPVSFILVQSGGNPASSYSIVGGSAQLDYTLSGPISNQCDRNGNTPSVDGSETLQVQASNTGGLSNIQTITINYSEATGKILDKIMPKILSKTMPKIL